MFFGNRASPNWAAHTDTQQHDAAARRLLRDGGLQRSKSVEQIMFGILDVSSEEKMQLAQCLGELAR